MKKKKKLYWPNPPDAHGNRIAGGRNKFPPPACDKNI